MPRDDDRPRRKPRRKGLRDAADADSRVYIHDACGGETEVSGDDFARLANPFAWVSQTYCASCSSFAGLGRFCWADTGEDVPSYRRRLRRRAPLSLKLWAWVFGPLLGMAIGAAIGWFAASKGPVAGAVAGGLTGALFFPLLIVPYLAKWVWGIDCRRMR
jgi:hypothetical protein